MSERKADFDSPWKETVEYYFEDFMAFSFQRRTPTSTGNGAMNSSIKSCNKWCATRNLGVAMPTN